MKKPKLEPFYLQPWFGALASLIVLVIAMASAAVVISVVFDFLNIEEAEPVEVENIKQKEN